MPVPNQKGRASWPLRLALSALLLLAAPRLNSALLSMSLKRAVTKGGGLTMTPTLDNWNAGEGKGGWMDRGWTSPAGLAGSDDLLGEDDTGDHGFTPVSASSCPKTHSTVG